MQGLSADLAHVRTLSAVLDRCSGWDGRFVSIYRNLCQNEAPRQS